MHQYYYRFRRWYHQFRIPTLKMNSIGAGVLQGINKAIDIAEKNTMD